MLTCLEEGLVYTVSSIHTYMCIYHMLYHYYQSPEAVQPSGQGQVRSAGDLNSGQDSWVSRLSFLT